MGHCDFFTYNWKLPAYNGTFYLQLCLGAFLLTVGDLYLQVKLFYLQWESASNKHLNGTVRTQKLQLYRPKGFSHLVGQYAPESATGMVWGASAGDIWDVQM